MALNVSSLTRNGLRDWLLQRFSALVLAVYILFLLGFFMLHSPLQYAEWRELFSHLSMKIFSVLFLLNLCIHSWVGIWTVITDYVKCSCLRLSLYSIVFTVLFITFVWGLTILWSV